MLAAGGWVTAQYDIPADEWYFAADRSGVMPFAVLLEIALQPCGWLAAYAGSALRSDRDLKFRNLGGSAVLHRQVTPGNRDPDHALPPDQGQRGGGHDHRKLRLPGPGRRTSRSTPATPISGFFSAGALDQQKGLGVADPMVRGHGGLGSALPTGRCACPWTPPRTPDATQGMSASVDGLQLPAKALLMVDGIEAFLPDGGARRDGDTFAAPSRWTRTSGFFKAHFYQDPVCPGSLGLESFSAADQKRRPCGAGPTWRHPTGFRLPTGSRHSWSYRGQIIPKKPKPFVVPGADYGRYRRPPRLPSGPTGLLSVDGLPIYKMENFELALVPAADTPPYGCLQQQGTCKR